MSKKSFSETDVITTEFVNQFVQEVQIKSVLSNIEPTGYKEIPSLKLVSDKFTSVLEANGTTAKTATTSANVSSTINGNAIANIFEGNGTTAKNATNSTTSANVSSTINGNAIANIFEGNGTTAKTATTSANVSSTINGNAITSIFEGNGTTAKNATNSTTSANVSSTINGKAIANIFEGNGTTAKNATKATQDSSGNTIASTYLKITGLIPASQVTITNGSSFGSATTLQGVLDYIAKVFSGTQTVSKLCANTFDAK